MINTINSPSHHLWSYQWCNPTTTRAHSIVAVVVIAVLWNCVYRVPLYHKLFSAALLVFFRFNLYKTLYTTSTIAILRTHKHKQTGKQIKYIKFNDENAFWFVSIFFFLRPMLVCVCVFCFCLFWMCKCVKCLSDPIDLRVMRAYVRACVWLFVFVSIWLSHF